MLLLSEVYCILYTGVAFIQYHDFQVYLALKVVFNLSIRVGVMVKG